VKRGMQYNYRPEATTADRPQGVGARPEAESNGVECSRNPRDEARERQPLRAFDARAFRELSQSVPIDPKSIRRTIRRNELRQIIPLADSTIFELERRGEFPQRFFLTARCVVWDLTEVEAWLESRRQPGTSDAVKKAPVPDFRKRKNRAVRENE
jgi:prophage regulatory protein